MPLIPASAFNQIFEPLQGKFVGLVELDGNVGDRLITLATIKLFGEYRIRYRFVTQGELSLCSDDLEYDELAISGGGNLGSFYPECIKVRTQALATGLPVTILPQSVIDLEEDFSRYQHIHLRDKASLGLINDRGKTSLAPDLALGLPDPFIMQPAMLPMGVFLREDEESVFADRSLSVIDPVVNNTTPFEYLSFAAHFSEIITDRLHFAIAGLIMRRQVTLLPNSYGKNRSMFDTWLQQLGCLWRDDLSGVDYDRQRVIDDLWKILAVSQEYRTGWGVVAGRSPGVTEESIGEHVNLQRLTTGASATLDPTAQEIWALCDGSRDLGSVTDELVAIYPDQRLEVATGVQKITTQLLSAGLLNKFPTVSVRPPSALEVTPLAERQLKGWIYKMADVGRPWGVAQRLWFAVPAEHATILSDDLDSFAIALIMRAMDKNLPLSLRGGAVSDGLLPNLAAFQATWHDWLPHLRPVEVFTDTRVSSAAETGAVLAFSGGLDSSYSMQQLTMAANEPIVRAATFVHGFDIPLCDEPGFNKAFARARTITDSAGIDLIPVRTNVRELVTDWEHSHGTALAAVLALFKKSFSSGVIASTLTLDDQMLWGSNPLTDPMLGSHIFKIVHHGAETSRYQKLKSLASWPHAVEHLRVCWRNPARDKNCGVCNKCVLTQLALRNLEMPLVAFDSPLSEHQLALAIPSRPSALDKKELIEISRSLDAQSASTPWGEIVSQRFA